MISTKGRYAVRFMLDLAEQPEGIPVPLDDAAHRQQISKKYLESIVGILSKAGLVEGASGKGGGYRLLKEPQDCTVGEILRLTEGTLAPINCVELCSEPCDRVEDCRTLPMWRKLDELIENYLDSVTVADLMQQNLADNYII